MASQSSDKIDPNISAGLEGDLETMTADEDVMALSSEDAVVLNYLHKHGLAAAALELKKILRDKRKTEEKDRSCVDENSDGEMKKRKHETPVGPESSGDDEAHDKLPKSNSTSNANTQHQELTNPATSSHSTADSLIKAVDRGVSNDLGAVPVIASYRPGYALISQSDISTLLLEGHDRDREDHLSNSKKESSFANHEDAKNSSNRQNNTPDENLFMLRDEARRYIEGFISLITWILTLPDDPANPIITSIEKEHCSTFLKSGDVDVHESEMGNGNSHRNRLKTVESEGKDTTNDGQEMQIEEYLEDDERKIQSDAQMCDIYPVEEERINTEPHHGGAKKLAEHAFAASSSAVVTSSFQSRANSNPFTLPLGATIGSTTPSSTSFNHDLLILPPSCKPELLALSFPLMVHTYCELISCGMERTARAFLETYRHLYEHSHSQEISDLEKCSTTKVLVELNDSVFSQNVIQREMKAVQEQIRLCVKNKEQLEEECAITARQEQQQKTSTLLNHESALAEVTNAITRLQNRLTDLSERNNAIQAKLSIFPFLRRVRVFKWNVTISTASFSALTGFVSSTKKLLPMSILLQSRCHLIVERRDPMPFCPPAILEDMDISNGTEGKNVDNVRWAAPTHPVVRAIEAGEDVLGSGVDGTEPHHKLARSILVHSEALPFPKYRLDEDKDENEVAIRSDVEFNRALLVNGFRRLEALELKREYEAGLLRSNYDSRRDYAANPLSPTILLGSLCSSAEADAGAGAPWAEANIGITSASICPPDGRKIAVGCDDAAVRIWSLDRLTAKSSKNASANCLGVPTMVLLGHKNGFPVFDVDWTRNGRTLISAGGDGTCRLWDTEAVGLLGQISNVSLQKSAASNSSTKNGLSSTSLSTVVVPGSKSEPLVEVDGAALAVYRGHAPSTPVWSVSSAPSGYYFASAGSDYTARIWATDRCTPIRVLSGHISPSVNCVTWHPNCNYVVTASDDKTCRMWDIQTGRCVRLLSGSSRGLNIVRVSPSGRYAAGASYDNVVHIWDLGNGRMMNELRPINSEDLSFSQGIINSLAFSSCGAALAVAGEDCMLRVWDVRGAGNHLSNPDYFAATRGPSTTTSIADGVMNSISGTQLRRVPLNERIRPGTRIPTQVYRTNNISVLDLKYTKRNLLLAVGNFAK